VRERERERERMDFHRNLEIICFLHMFCFVRVPQMETAPLRLFLIAPINVRDISIVYLFINV